MKAVVTWEPDHSEQTVRSRSSRMACTDARFFEVTPVHAGAGQRVTLEAVFRMDLGKVSPQRAAVEPMRSNRASFYPKESALRRMALERPADLVRLIRDEELPGGLLARAAEAAGLIEDSSVAVPVLLKLLSHPTPVVQEAAVYGLESHLEASGVREAIRAKADAPDTGDGVREASLEALDED